MFIWHFRRKFSAIAGLLLLYAQQYQWNRFWVRYIYMKYPWQTRNRERERESLKEKEMEWCIECRTNIEPEQKFCRVNLSTFI